MRILTVTPNKARYVEISGTEEELNSSEFRNLPCFADWDDEVPAHKLWEFLDLCPRDRTVVEAYLEMDFKALRTKSITEVLYSLKKVYRDIEDWVEDVLPEVDEAIWPYIDKQKYLQDHLHKYPIVEYKRQWYWFS